MYRLVEQIHPYLFGQEEALEYLNLTHFDGDRQLNENHASQLADTMDSGEFIGNRIAIARFSGATYGVNGRHTSKAVLLVTKKDVGPLSNYKAPCTKLTFECNSMKELASLHACFDQRISTRTLKDMCFAYQHAIKGFQGLSPRLVKLCVQGIDLMQRKTFNLSRELKQLRTDFLKAKLMDDYEDAIKFVCGAFGDPNVKAVKKSRFMQLQYVVWAMVETFIISPTLAREFWPRVASGVGLRQEDARLCLRDELNNYHIFAQTKKFQKERPYVACVCAWNKWLKGSPVTNLQTRYKAKRPRPKAPTS